MRAEKYTNLIPLQMTGRRACIFDIDQSIHESTTNNVKKEMAITDNITLITPKLSNILRLHFLNRKIREYIRRHVEFILFELWNVLTSKTQVLFLHSRAR